MRPLQIGLTGGIGSGKSTVAQVLVELGATLVDTDAIARRLTAPHGAALSAIEQAFGSGMVSDQRGLDRDRMRTLAFSDPLARRRLEAILHPLIGENAQAEAMWPSPTTGANEWTACWWSIAQKPPRSAG